MKTVFISVFHSAISRNILNTGILRMLENDCRIILLVPDYKIIFFDRYKSERVFVEGISTKLTKRDLIFRKISLWLLPTETVLLKNKTIFALKGNILSYILFRLVSLTLARMSIVHRCFRKIDLLLPDRSLFNDLFTCYKPDLVFSTDAQNELDVLLLKVAKKTGTKHIAMIRSWDNLTSKGILRLIPGKILVNNHILERELKKFDFIRPELISVIGIPHYDRYGSFKTESRESFFASCGFDLTKKLIVYAPIGDRYISPNTIDEKVVKALSSLGENILVRLPPSDTVQSLSGKDFGSRVFLDHTGVRSWKLKWGKEGAKVNEISEEDDTRLITSLRHADVLVSGPTTMIIDAAVFDKPIVTVDFEGEKKIKYALGVRRYYDYTHLDFIRQSGGVRYAKTLDELLAFVRKYFSDPKTDSLGREKIVSGECYALDGRSTERLYNAIKDSL